MAWRPTQYLIEGELENRTAGKVTGWLRFVGMQKKVTFDLAGDFHRDIRGAAIRVTGPGLEAEPDLDEPDMSGFCSHQIGEAGDITAGLPPFDYGQDPYIEWYSQNGRVVLEPVRESVRVLGTPIPYNKIKPIDRTRQDGLITVWMAELAQQFNVPAFATKLPVEQGDGAFTHWIQLPGGKVIGEAEPLTPVIDDMLPVRARIFNLNNVVVIGVVSRSQLKPKENTSIT